MKLFALAALALILIPTAAHAQYFMYLFNPDSTRYKILWNGPGPNRVVNHPELGPNVQVACWLIHNTFSHLPNAGLVTRENEDGAVPYWVEPARTKVPGTDVMYLYLKVDAGSPAVIQNERFGQYTWWVAIDGTPLKQVRDCQ